MNSRIEREVADIVNACFRQEDGYWRDVLERSWLNTANACVIIFHPQEPCGHIIQDDEGYICLGRNPNEFIEVKLEDVEAKLHEIGLPLYDWK